MDGKIKTAKGKVPMALIPLKALYGAARVFAYGAKKYLPGNWRKATIDDGAIERYVGGALRHMSECQRDDGTWDLEQLMHLDEESGLPALDHLICGLIMLRGIAIKAGALADPGEGKEPPHLRDDQDRLVEMLVEEAEAARGAADVFDPLHPIAGYKVQAPAKRLWPAYKGSERVTPVLPSETYLLDDRPYIVRRRDEARRAVEAGKRVYCILHGTGAAVICDAAGNCSSSLFLVPLDVDLEGSGLEGVE